MTRGYCAAHGCSWKAGCAEARADTSSDKCLNHVYIDGLTASDARARDELLRTQRMHDEEIRVIREDYQRLREQPAREEQQAREEQRTREDQWTRDETAQQQQRDFSRRRARAGRAPTEVDQRRQRWDHLPLPNLDRVHGCKKNKLQKMLYLNRLKGVAAKQRRRAPTREHLQQSIFVSQCYIKIRRTSRPLFSQESSTPTYVSPETFLSRTP
ncbi:hypothetical protein B0J13DRAFT_668998 [Dactylonectria estremocensis]|uniref:Uncharacterized protein n=1 Tax=Dactylonectria estremocensis TaxID=1079267 RepID=A0A9P9JI30_9HYPO|nr:hypothetical protein B0J13DRAFT_668998 [Dactylonectria estremocensis]